MGSTHEQSENTGRGISGLRADLQLKQMIYNEGWPAWSAFFYVDSQCNNTDYSDTDPFRSGMDGTGQSKSIDLEKRKPWLPLALCWNCDPEVTYVLEYTPSKMLDSEIIKMAESAEPVE